MSAPLTSSATLAMPSGLQTSLTATRQITLSNPADPLSVTAYTTTATINGRTFRSSYARSTRVLTLTSPQGRTQTSTFDSADHPVSIQIPGLTSLSLGYEGPGLLSSVSSGTRQSTFTYDEHLRLKTLTDPMHRTFSFDYDNADRVTTETFPDGRQVSFKHDAAGNVTSVTPPSRPTHAFAFTPIDLLQTYSAPAVANVVSTTTTYGYNRDKQLTSVLRPDGTTIGFSYDTAGHLSTITEPLGTHRYTYDGSKGTLASIFGPDGTEQFTYDGDLLKSMISSGGPVSASVGLNYDANFRVTSETINGSNAITFGYDNDDLLTSAGALTLRRDTTNGLLTGSTIGNLVDTYGYNGFGETTSYALQLSGSTIFTLGYTRDDAGRISTKTETANGQTATTSYTYDPVGRLTDVATGTATTHYGYDDNGNRTSVQSPTGSVITATYDAQDRLTTYNGASYFYSDNGELQKKIDVSGTTTYTFDVFGNLREVTLPSGDVIDYVIDAANRRVGKKLNGTLVAGWIYGGHLRIIAETDGTGAITKRFVYGSRSSVPDYMVWQGATYRIVTDQVGSPRYVLQTTSGTLAEALTFDAFGNVLADTNPGFIPFGFAGGLYDRDTKFVRFGARDYEPQTGRWTAKDLIGFGGGDSNVYAYATSDPINYVDSTGLDSMTDDPDVLSEMASLMRKGLTDPTKSEYSAQLYRGGDQRFYCKYLGSSKSGASNKSKVVKGMTDSVYVHTHPDGKTERADDTDDRSAINQIKMPGYVLSRGGIHKFVPNGKDSEELSDRDFYKKNGYHWYDFTNSNVCPSCH
jgi:RHS repeat-associated protein